MAIILKPKNDEHLDPEMDLNCLIYDQKSKIYKTKVLLVISNIFKTVSFLAHLAGGALRIVILYE